MSRLGLLAIAGCASASDDGRTAGASLALHDDNGAWRAAPLGRDAPALALHADHAYAGSIAAADLACRHTARLVLYPQGAAVTVP